MMSATPRLLNDVFAAVAKAISPGRAPVEPSVGTRDGGDST
jgi:hypothetical protein